MNLKAASVSEWNEKAKNLVLPGFDGVPISHVAAFVIKGFTKGVLVTRASSIAFNLLIALLPASIFLFTLIPFIPLPNFQEEIIRLFESFLPADAYGFLESTIVDVVTNKSGGLLLIMFIATVVFSTNGIHAIIHAFIVSAHNFRSRSWVNQRKISVVLLGLVLFLISVAGSLVIFGKIAVNKLAELDMIEKTMVFYILIVIKWILIMLLLFLAISFLYYLAPAKRTEFRFFSPGSTLATVLFILTSLGFSAYVNNFGHYNKLYGSIGTLMVILIWLYLNSIAILIGFELNVSINAAKHEDEEKIRTISCNEETA
jgi:membrane protein